MKNFIIRTLTSVIFVAVLVGCIVFNLATFGLLFFSITVLTVTEFCHIMNQRKDVQLNTVITSMAGGYLFLAFFMFCSQLVDVAVFIPYLLVLMFLFISELYLKNPNPLANWALSMMSQLYIALPFSLLCMLSIHVVPTDLGLYQRAYLWYYPFSLFCFIWANDAGAYLIGSLLHNVFPAKLFPRISPKKSWIGSIGGGLLAMVVAYLIWLWQTHQGEEIPNGLSLVHWIGFALVVTVFGTWGDLTESLMKRHLGIKDSGSILPGHGGMLDRFDSTLMAVPASVVYLYIVQMMIEETP